MTRTYTSPLSACSEKYYRKNRYVKAENRLVSQRFSIYQLIRLFRVVYLFYVFSAYAKSNQTYRVYTYHDEFDFPCL